MNTTINISLPKTMYEDTKKMLGKRGYASISEFIRESLRTSLYPKLTENGFTPEFEEEVLKSAASPIENDIVFRNDKELSDYFLYSKYPPKIKKADGKNKTKRRVRRNVSKVGRGRTFIAGTSSRKNQVV